MRSTLKKLTSLSLLGALAIAAGSSGAYAFAALELTPAPANNPALLASLGTVETVPGEVSAAPAAGTRTITCSGTEIAKIKSTAGKDKITGSDSSILKFHDDGTWESKQDGGTYRGPYTSKGNKFTATLDAASLGLFETYLEQEFIGDVDITFTSSKMIIVGKFSSKPATAKVKTVKFTGFQVSDPSVTGTGKYKTKHKCTETT